MRTQKPNQCKDPFQTLRSGRRLFNPSSTPTSRFAAYFMPETLQRGVLSTASLQLGVADLRLSLPVQRNIWALSAGESSISLTSGQMRPLEQQGSLLTSPSPISHCLRMVPSTPGDTEPQQWGEGCEEKPCLAALCLTPGVQG